jgi:hypothetical protein
MASVRSRIVASAAANPASITRRRSRNWISRKPASARSFAAWARRTSLFGWPFFTGKGQILLVGKIN